MRAMSFSPPLRGTHEYKDSCTSEQIIDGDKLQVYSEF